MRLYLVSNNLVLNDLSYETLASVDEKRLNRPLAILGEEKANQLSQKLKVEALYASSYASALATAKYFSQVSNITIMVNQNFNDVKIGEMGRHNIKMLRFMQDKNFDYQYPSGESLNQAKRRMNLAIQKIISQNDGDILICSHKRAIMAYLLNYCTIGYNLEENLILSYQDKVILDDTENDIDIVEITIEDNKVVDINYREI